MTLNLGQLITAMVTPFDNQGKIDFQSLTKLIHHLIKNDTETIIVSGTTGEFPTLTKEEKTSLFEYTVNEVNGKIPVIAGTGTNDTHESILLTKIAKAAGVDGIMVVAPYFSRPSQEGMYRHFKSIAESTDLPVMIYNIPGRTAVNLSAETIIRLSNISNIETVKEASGEIDTASFIIENTRDDFKLYSGNDDLTLPLMSVGASGIVSVSSHIIGSNMSQMMYNFTQGNVELAAKQHRELLPVMKMLFMAPNPTPVKTILEEKGIIKRHVRSPMIDLSEEERQLINKNIQLFSL